LPAAKSQESIATTACPHNGGRSRGSPAQGDRKSSERKMRRRGKDLVRVLIVTAWGAAMSRVGGHEILS
jgi:hypothetical protein